MLDASLKNPAILKVSVHRVKNLIERCEIYNLPESKTIIVNIEKDRQGWELILNYLLHFQIKLDPI